jgi:hypothetical protein
MEELSKEEKIKMKLQLRLETIAHEMYHQVDESVNIDIADQKKDDILYAVKKKMNLIQQAKLTYALLNNPLKKVEEELFKKEFSAAEEEVNGYTGDEDKKGYLNQSGCNLIAAPPKEFNRNRLYVERRARLFEMILRNETGIEGILEIGVKKK